MRDPLLVLLLAELGLAGCDGGPLFGDRVDGYGCAELKGDTCPAPEDVDPASLSDANYCDYTEIEVTSTQTPDPQPGWGGDTGTLYCCYETVAVDETPNSSCAIGRPLLRDGRPVLAEVPDGVEGIAADWLLYAQMEHASVAAFHALGLQLLALGAPLDLLDAVARAARDEVHHADGAFRLASRFAGRPLAPGPLAAGPVGPVSLVDLAAAAAREGCVGETLGALLARESALVATDPEARAFFVRVAEDEAQHAALSWRLVAWALAEGGVPVREAVVAALRESPALVRTADAPAVGLLGPETTAAVVARGIREVLDPAARVLLAA